MQRCGGYGDSLWGNELYGTAYDATLRIIFYRNYTVLVYSTWSAAESRGRLRLLGIKKKKEKKRREGKREGDTHKGWMDG